MINGIPLLSTRTWCCVPAVLKAWMASVTYVFVRLVEAWSSKHWPKEFTFIIDITMRCIYVSRNREGVVLMRDILIFRGIRAIHNSITWHAKEFQSNVKDLWWSVIHLEPLTILMKMVWTALKDGSCSWYAVFVKGWHFYFWCLKFVDTLHLHVGIFGICHCKSMQCIYCKS